MQIKTFNDFDKHTLESFSGKTIQFIEINVPGQDASQFSIHCLIEKQDSVANFTSIKAVPNPYANDLSVAKLDRRISVPHDKTISLQISPPESLINSNITVHVVYDNI